MEEFGPNFRATLGHEANMYFTAYCTLKVKLIEWLFIPGADALMLTVYGTPMGVPGTGFEGVPPPPLELPAEVPPDPLPPEPLFPGLPLDPQPADPPHAHRPTSAISTTEPKTNGKCDCFLKTARIINKNKPTQMPTAGSSLPPKPKRCAWEKTGCRSRVARRGCADHQLRTSAPSNRGRVEAARA